MWCLNIFSRYRGSNEIFEGAIYPNPILEFPKETNFASTAPVHIHADRRIEFIRIRRSIFAGGKFRC